MAIDKGETGDKPAGMRERAAFKRLLATNINYFGNIPGSKLKPVKKIIENTSYEELTCVGFNPETDLLEATISVKRSKGYGGPLCSKGTVEYVRFFLNYGKGWEDAGLGSARVHDIPDGRDCAKKPEKPLKYVASIRLDPKRRCCNRPVLPKVRAILSWQWIPPAGSANAGWTPPWGNRLECTIQIKPRKWSISCMLAELKPQLPGDLKIPPEWEAVQDIPIPLPDPPPYSLAQIAGVYKAKGKSKKAAEQFTVEPHRFGMDHLVSTKSEGAVNQEALVAQKAEWDALDINYDDVIGALEETKANTSYEELECLGLETSPTDRLVAIFRIKRESGYSGNLCRRGSFEYVTFWADWDDKCEWKYMGTARVKVHDIDRKDNADLCYAAILPVDLTYHRRHCSRPKLGRVRAVLSWNTPASKTDPDDLNHWGNRLDRHVLIPPGEGPDPGEPPVAKIRALGGIPVEDIATATSGLTLPTAEFFYDDSPADPWGLNRPCPFGGRVLVHGQFYQGYWYRVKVRNTNDPPTAFSVLDESFKLLRWDTGSDTQVATNGFFPYLNPAEYLEYMIAKWQSSGDDLWEVQLDLATGPNVASIISSSPWYKMQLDNTRPELPSTMDIHIDAGGDCKDFTEGAILTGTFVAQDAHFGRWSLNTLPDTPSTPSNDPVAIPALASTSPTDSTPNPSHPWTLDTGSPKKMKPCGYVVRLVVRDRSIVNSLPGHHNWNHTEVGFCLREKKP